MLNFKLFLETELERPNDIFMRYLQDKSENTFKKLFYALKPIVYKELKLPNIDNDEFTSAFGLAMAKLKNNPSMIDIKYDMVGFIVTIVKNKLIDYYRLKKRREKINNRLTHDPIGDNSEPIDMLHKQELQRIYQLAFSRLSKEDKDIITMKQTMTFDDIAKKFNITFNQAVNKHRMALTRLKRIIEIDMNISAEDLFGENHEIFNTN